MLPGLTNISNKTIYLMVPVKILHVTVVAALELRDQLLSAGLVQNQDFEWEYRQAEYETFGSAVSPRQVEFRFRDPVLATYYQLKWAQ